MHRKQARHAVIAEHDYNDNRAGSAKQGAADETSRLPSSSSLQSKSKPKSKSKSKSKPSADATLTVGVDSRGRRFFRRGGTQCADPFWERVKQSHPNARRETERNGKTTYRAKDNSVLVLPELDEILHFQKLPASFDVGSGSFLRKATAGWNMKRLESTALTRFPALQDLPVRWTRPQLVYLCTRTADDAISERTLSRMGDQEWEARLIAPERTQNERIAALPLVPCTYARLPTPEQRALRELSPLPDTLASLQRDAKLLVQLDLSQYRVFELVSGDIDVLHVWFDERDGEVFGTFSSRRQLSAMGAWDRSAHSFVVAYSPDGGSSEEAGAKAGAGAGAKTKTGAGAGAGAGAGTAAAMIESRGHGRACVWPLGRHCRIEPCMPRSESALSKLLGEPLHDSVAAHLQTVNHSDYIVQLAGAPIRVSGLRSAMQSSLASVSGASASASAAERSAQKSCLVPVLQMLVSTNLEREIGWPGHVRKLAVYSKLDTERDRRREHEQRTVRVNTDSVHIYYK